MARTYWKGYLKLSLVTCPVTMAPATSESERVRFHTLNRETGNRIVSRYIDAGTGRPVEAEDEVRGYQAEDDRFVILEDDELEAVALESQRTIEIETFVAQDSIPWAYLDKPHFLSPGDEVGEEAFAVIREAMAAKKKVGISRIVLYRRERAVMLEPRDRGIILWTLRYGDEVRDAKPYFAEVGKEKPDSELLQLAKRLIEDRSKPWSPAMVEDPVQEHLLKLIASKRKRRSKPSAPEKGSGGKVVNLFDALKKSLQSEGGKRS